MRPCRHRLSATERTRWAGHLCGLCLTLRDEVGHDARLATSYDGLLLSVLVEDLAPDGVGHRRAGPCPLRGMRPARVVASTAAAAQLAASVSLLLAAAKVADHVADGQAPRAMRLVSRRWERAGRLLVDGVGLDPRAVLGPVADQAGVEAVGGRDLCSYTAPTEAATSAAFAHAAVLSGRPDFGPGLATAGAAFGRLAHLLDAVEDEADDRRAGRFNPLAASGTSRSEARTVAERCVIGLRHGLGSAGLTGSTLAHRLLVHEAGHAVRRIFDHPAEGSGPLGCLLVACPSCAEMPNPLPGKGRRRCGRCCSGCDCCEDGCDACDCCCCCAEGASCCDCCNCCDGCDC